jgi:proline iminopeptidase
MQRLDDPFFPLEPTRAEGLLERDGGHAIHWNDAGGETNMPVIMIHGGPGGASNQGRRRLYDPRTFRVVQFDQRGCGKSTPTGALEANSLQATLGDIEALREHLGIDKWMVAGGSWGSTVAVAYAEAFPERCLGINLTCLWLCRREDVHWWFHGVRTMFPELWDSFASLVSSDERNDLRAAYVRRILGNDPEAAKTAGEHLYLYEQGFMQFDVPLVAPDVAAKGAAYGRIFAHHAANWFFLRDNQLLDDAPRIAHLPIELVTGRYDCCTPPTNSYDFRARLPNVHLTIVPGGGHSSSEVAMSHEVARAPGRLYERIVAGGGWHGR